MPGCIHPAPVRNEPDHPGEHEHEQEGAVRLEVEGQAHRQRVEADRNQPDEQQERDERVLPREDSGLDVAQRDEARRQQHPGSDGSLLGAGADAGNEGDDPHRDERERDRASRWSRVADAQPSCVAQCSVTSIGVSTRSVTGFSTRTGSGRSFLGKMRSSATARAMKAPTTASATSATRVIGVAPETIA